MRIEILFCDGCPHYRLAEQHVREVLGELGVAAEVARIRVANERAAEEMRFPGSPTVRVDGADVDPDSNGVPFCVGCRMYATSSGLVGAPDKDSIRAAIERVSR